MAPLLSPLGHLYAGLMQVRARAFANHLFSSWRPDVPCISVGNISWGGTGKTPLVSWLLSWASTWGLHPVVLTRGYHAHPPHLPFHVTPDTSPDQAGDEPLMLARHHQHAQVVVDPKRTRSGPWAQQQLHPDLFVLDDGFQHLAAHRDINMVVLGPQDLCQGWNKVIPAGSWREGQKALGRAHVFVVNVTGSSLDRLFPLAMERLQPFDCPIFFARLVPTGLAPIRNHTTIHLPEKTPYFLFTGIANPQRVLSTARELLETDPAGTLFFPDHHAFSREDRECIAQRALEAQATAMVCTPKDAIKLGQWDHPRVFQLTTRLAFVARARTSLWLGPWLAQKLENL
jgi:tetraacyldisaccharide 4'-kinase